MWNEVDVLMEKGSQEPETPVLKFCSREKLILVTLYVAKFELWVRKAHLEQERLSLLLFLAHLHNALFINKR